MMKIDCYLSKNCGSESNLRENIEKALKLEAAEACVGFHRLTDVEAALRGLKGSPTIFINGREVQPGDLTGFT